MSHRHLVIITKIILFYSLFVVAMKLIFLFQQYIEVESAREVELFSALAWSQFILMLPFLILAAIAFLKMKKEQYSKVFVIIGAAVIIGIRIYEIRLLEYLQNYFLS